MTTKKLNKPEVSTVVSYAFINLLAIMMFSLEHVALGVLFALYGLLITVEHYYVIYINNLQKYRAYKLSCYARQNAGWLNIQLSPRTADALVKHLENNPYSTSDEAENRILLVAQKISEARNTRKR